MGTHTTTVSRIVALPSGDRLATACWNGNAWVFSTGIGACLQTLSIRVNGSGVMGLAALGGGVEDSDAVCGGLHVRDAPTGESL
jgi:hypothetical protein